MLKRIRRLFPTSQLHIEKVRDVFEKYDADKDGAIGLNELASMFAKISGRLTALPAVSSASACVLYFARLSVPRAAFSDRTSR
jgi:NADH dehydrogenase